MTNEVTRMAHAEMMKVTHNIDKSVKMVDEKVQVVIDGASTVLN